MSNRHKSLGRNRGLWAPSTFYSRTDVVNRFGALYSAKQDFTSGALFDLSNWDTLLESASSNVKSTVGAGLPLFANRMSGDLHFNTTTGKEYVLTGAGGGAFSDTFSNVVDNADLNGRTTESGGLTWSAANSTLHTGSGGYASGGSYGTYYGFVNMGPGNQTLQGVSGSQYGYGCINAPYAGVYGGYTLAGNNSQGRIYISLSRSNAAIGNTSVGGGPGAGTDDPYFFDGAPDQNIQWTLSRVGSLITATISNTAGANTRTLTYTDSDPLNGAWAGAWSSISWIAFEMSGVSNGTLAWIPLTTDAAPLSQRLAGASVNTIGTSLPDFLGRASGDIHWDSVLKKEYILSGAAGGYWADSFNRANAATLGNTEIGGLAWFSSGAQILNNRVVGNPTTSGVTLRLNVGASTSSTQKFDINRAASAGGGSGWSAKFRCDSNGAGGYNVYVRTDQGSTNMLVIERNGVPVNGTHGQDQTPYPAAVPTVGAGMEEPVTATITVAEAAGSLTISVKFVRLSDGLVWDGGVLYTDTTPLANSAYVQLSNSGGDNGTGYIDNYGVQSNGTLKWNRTEIDPVPPTLRTVGASLITQGPGLPSVSDRLPNDLHYNSTLHKTSILTGTPGVLLTDSALGRTSLNPPSDGGGANTAWVNTTTATFLVDADGIYLSSQGFGNGAFGYEGFHIYRPVVTTDAAISADYRRGGASMGLYFAANDNSSIEVLMDTDGSVSLWRKTAPDGNGYTSNVDYVSPLVPGSNPIALSGTISATLSSAGVVTVVINGASYTGQLTPLSAITRVGVGMQNTGVNRFKNIMIPQDGSLAWTHIEPIYLQAQLASGNVATGSHVLKPGIRVPTATNLREMILRCDTAPTGAPITVQVERWNGGVNYGVVGTASIPVGDTVGSITTLFVPCARGDILKFNVTSVGSTVTGADLTTSVGFF